MATIPPVPYQSPVADKSGILTNIWSAWFRQLLASVVAGGSGSGTVTSVSVASANGLNGTVANATTTPAITLKTSITGLLKGDGTAISAQATGDLTDVGTDGITVTGGTGAVIGSGTAISQHVADTTHNGYLSSTDWNTFNGKQSALTIGNLTDVGTDGITVTGGTSSVIGSGVSISQHVADATHNGYLSSTDWSTFNGKQASGNYITALTGDVSASGPGSAAATISAATVTGKAITGYVSGAGTVAATDSILAAIQKLNGNDGLKAVSTRLINTTAPITGGGDLSADRTIAMAAATTSVNGYLTSTDWNTFNGKQAGPLTGDVTTSGAASTIASNAVTTAKINNSAVTYAKIQNVSANSVLLGAGASGSGAAPTEITLGTGLSMTGTVLAATGGGLANPTSEIWVSRYNSRGSTNTSVIYFVNTLVSTGSDITYTASTVNGDKWVINTAGVYAITSQEVFGTTLGITRNSTTLATTLPSGGVQLVASCALPTGGGMVCTTLNLSVNDVIRLQSAALNGADDKQYFRIVRVN